MVNMQVDTYIPSGGGVNNKMMGGGGYSPSRWSNSQFNNSEKFESNNRVLPADIGSTSKLN